MWRKFFRGKRFFAVATAFFVVLVFFFDKNSLINSMRVGRKIRALESQREYYLQKIREDSIAIENLKDVNFLEKFARENYYMKRENEDIYLVR